ncbi:MAG: hypothetical protein ABEH65_07055 [Halobacteriales archaeon]
MSHISVILQATIPITLIIVFISLAAVALALGVYLVVTNPPKDDEAFIGIGKEKVSDKEFEEWQQEFERKREERRERRRNEKEEDEWKF